MTRTQDIDTLSWAFTGDLLTSDSFMAAFCKGCQQGYDDDDFCPSVPYKKHCKRHAVWKEIADACDALTDTVVDLLLTRCVVDDEEGCETNAK